MCLKIENKVKFYIEFILPYFQVIYVLFHKPNRIYLHTF